MSISGQSGPHSFKRQHRKRDVKPTEGPTPHLIHCCCVLQQEPLQSENRFHHHISSVELPWYSRDTHSSCGGWEDTEWHCSTIHCATQPVNATLIFHSIHRGDTSCFCHTNLSELNYELDTKQYRIWGLYFKHLCKMIFCVCFLNAVSFTRGPHS